MIHNYNDFDLWLDINYNRLSEEYLNANSELWSCEDEGMELLESSGFIDFVEEEYCKVQNEEM